MLYMLNVHLYVVQARASLLNDDICKLFMHPLYLLHPRWWTRKGQNILEIFVIWSGTIAELPLSTLCWTHWHIYIYIYICVCVCVCVCVCIMHGKYGQYSEKTRQGRWPAEQKSTLVMPYTKKKRQIGFSMLWKYYYYYVNNNMNQNGWNI